MLDQLRKFFRNLGLGHGDDAVAGRARMLSLAKLGIHLLLWPWRWLTRPRPRRWPILRPYVNPRHPVRIIAKILFPIALAFFCLIYGFMFGLTAPFLLIQFALPILALLMLSIWALPETDRIPTAAVEIFFAGLIVSLMTWPNYLALALPGLPWITAIRLCTFPMAFLFLFSLSSSRGFRSQLASALRSTPGISLAFAALVIIQVFTLPFSKYPSESFQFVVLYQINITLVFLTAVWVAQTPGRVERYIMLILVLTIPMIIISLFEARVTHVLWLNHVPSFLKVDDELAARYLTSATRGDKFRVKSIYSTPLSFAEALALITPFCIHVMANKYNVAARFACFAAIIIFFLCINMTDARLGMVGMFVSVLAYVLLQGLLHLRRNAGSLMAAAIVYAYPATFAVAMGGVLFVHRLHVLVFGNGESAASNDARNTQIQMGIPKILHSPWGYGAGNAAETLNYQPFGFITIDNYFLSVVLDYGILGLIMFVTIFAAAILAAVKSVLQKPAGIDTREKTLLVPLAVSMTVFLVIKSVLSQEDNHALAYLILGLLVGLTHRVAVSNAQALGADSQAVDRLKPTRARLQVRQPAVQLSRTSLRR